MNYIWRDECQVRASEVDFLGRIRPSDIFKLMQEAAEHSASSLGFGIDYVKENNIFWVLSRVNLVIYDLPHQNDLITVETWPKGANRVFAMRDFKIFSKDKLCAVATTAWLLLDGNTRSMIKLENFPGNKELYAIKDAPPKLRTKLEFSESYSKKIRISELDVNNHVNNARYIEWALDSIDYDIYKQNKTTEVAINYITEMKYGDNAIIRKTNFVNNEVYVDAINENTGKQSFVARLRFEKDLT